MHHQNAPAQILSDNPPSFNEIALPLANRGIKVIPVRPLSKEGVLKDQFRYATTSPEQIECWNHENPNYNVGCVGTPDTILILDCDVKGLIQRIEQETGQQLPPTLVVRSAGKGCAHIYFRQTDTSRKLGNKKRAGLFDLQSVDKYVVGPGSRLENGRTYEIVQDEEIAEFPDWLAEWIIANADPEKPKPQFQDARPVAESFDLADLLEHYEIGYQQDGDWYITDLCPVAGRKHEQSTRTGFFFDGHSLGFHCFATGCQGNTMTAGQVISFLNKDHEPFIDAIWEEPLLEELLDELAVEVIEEASASDPDEEVNGQSAEPVLPESFDRAITPNKDSDPLAFPERSMYGEAGVLARQMKMPLGLAYMAVLGMFSIKCEHDVMCGTRINAYTALIAIVGGGKNVAMDRAKALLDLRYKDEYLPASPAGTRALMNLIGDKPSGKKNRERVPGPKKLLLITHEMTDVLKMTGVDNSTLASRLCDFWDDNEHVYPTGKDGVISVDCRLHWIGGVPASADNPTRFTELFDSETSHGLYDRLLMGYSGEKFNYRTWEVPRHADEQIDFTDYTSGIEPVPFVSAISDGAQKLIDEWQPVGGGSRIKQNCMKVALITTMMNREETVTEECMRCAIGIMEWQIELRKVFRPGEAVNDEAKCRVVILSAMEAAGAREKYVNLKRMAHDRKWGDRFGDRIVKNTIKNLQEMCEIVPRLIKDGDGTRKSTSDFRLHSWFSNRRTDGENGEGGDSPSTNSEK
jgi:Bifunctional DNA primase/polymerase, N-terminal